MYMYFYTKSENLFKKIKTIKKQCVTLETH